MAEMLTYAPDLRSITGGQGDYTLEFLRYEEVPGHLAQKVVDAGRRGARGQPRLTLDRDRDARHGHARLACSAMATRSIVTSQPDVACDVCERRLLRGEQPDVFLGAGERRTVCELCAPRAAHEGWLRETGRPVGEPARRCVPARAQPVRAPAPGRQAGRLRAEEAAQSSSASPCRPSRRPTTSSTATRQRPRTRSAEQPPHARGSRRAAARDRSRRAAPRRVERALAVFNAGEHPRRVAGVARSLGAPERRASVPSRTFGSAGLDRRRLGALLVPLRGRPRATTAPRRTCSRRAPSSRNSPREDRLANAVADESRRAVDRRGA